MFLPRLRLVGDLYGQICDVVAEGVTGRPAEGQTSRQAIPSFRQGRQRIS